jgi:hypothetical protein
MGWIEDAADARLAAEVLTALQAAGGRPERAGWLAWDDIREEWGEEDRQDVSLSAFEKDWDNPEDVVYDDWRDLLGVPAQPAR